MAPIPPQCRTRGTGSGGLEREKQERGEEIFIDMSRFGSGQAQGAATSCLNIMILEEKKTTFIFEKGTVHLPQVQGDEISLQFIVMD